MLFVSFKLVLQDVLCLLQMRNMMTERRGESMQYKRVLTLSFEHTYISAGLCGMLHRKYHQTLDQVYSMMVSFIDNITET